ncbi:MAG: amidase domain-containing protein [Clostridia bacterium]|nr:amidase domain-containing protein [Clostridia bacterium]
MLIVKTYQRTRALLYAERWAFSRNPLFTDYQNLGGNCTNFVSQCVLAGSCVMNFTPVFGWYYRSDSDRSPSWTGVPYFYDFIVGNQGVGPFGREASPDELETGDVIQLGNEQDGFYHSLLVVGKENGNYLVAAQTDDALGRPLSSYTYEFARYIRIEGVRLSLPDSTKCFEDLYNGTALLPAQNDFSESNNPQATENAD